MASTDSIALDPTQYRLLSSTTTTSGSSELGRDDFLKLLVTKMENQNPLEPAEDTEFIAQLATFSSLEQLIDLNTRMESLTALQGDLLNSQALNMIGREVLADTDNTLRVTSQGAEDVVFDLSSAPSSVRVAIYDESGKVIRTEYLENPVSGRNTFTWDGKDEGGDLVDNGQYEYEIYVTDASGKETKIDGLTSVMIEGIQVGVGGLALISGNRQIAFADVAEIRLAGAADNTETNN